LRALHAGADGVISGIAAAVPELLVALQSCAANPDDRCTAPLAAQMNEFIDWIDQFPPTVAIKEAAEMRRWLQSTVAVPLLGETAARLLSFREWFDAWLPATLALCKQATVRP
jgi:dihydrodipicolinate synthase/N-acetylneuraminate lyase